MNKPTQEERDTNLVGNHVDRIYTLSIVDKNYNEFLKLISNIKINDIK